MREVEVAIVLIGRNEGERLRRCVESIPADVPAVYVDSGSTDGSVELAQARGLDTIDLDVTAGFTAAKARNAGWRALKENQIRPKFVQFVDGDCELREGWIEAGCAALEQDPKLAAVFGRRRERFPETSIYNQMCDDEWNVPLGIVSSCGGDAIFRMEAIEAVDGYCDDLIAGEEPDLCLRLRRLGWLIRRIDCEMTWHDAAILNFRSWWLRVRRGGFAFAEHVRRHRAGADPAWRRQLLSIAFWGLLLPLGLLVLAIIAWANRPAFFTVLLLSVAVYLGQALRIGWRKYRAGAGFKFAIRYGLLIVLAKFAELGGAVRCLMTQLLRRKAKIIEYKGPV